MTDLNTPFKDRNSENGLKNLKQQKEVVSRDYHRNQ